jgi:poly-gamma-glutamate capsule biosynthesis protein CapA/YwtB (metallophosphatase superfamily)
MGDVMLGRLIDQMFPTHNTSPEDAEYANSCLRVMGQRRLTSSYVWGDMLKEIKSARFKMLNLETAITTSDDAEEGKVFTFRMHPDNVTTLQEIGAPVRI